MRFARPGRASPRAGGTYLLLLCLALLAACAKTSKEMTLDLWRDWSAYDALLQADHPEAPPIILVHGWNGSEFTWPSPQKLQRLEKELGRDIYFFTFRTGIVIKRFPPLEILEEQLERYLSSFRQVDVVAHSMGGLLVRQYLSHHAEHPVRRVVFLSVPHFGTDAARMLVRLAAVSPLGNPQAEEMQPGSDFLWNLNALAGVELKGMTVLNVFIEDGAFAESDLVVSVHSAYLPGVVNMAVKGDHHTLAERLTDFSFITDFLGNAVLPQGVGPPPRRDAWLRFRHTGGGGHLRFAESSVRRLDAKGRLHPGGFGLCCAEPTGLLDAGATTIVVENVMPNDALVFTPRKGLASLVLRGEDLRDMERPVMLWEIEVPLKPQ